MGCSDRSRGFTLIELLVVVTMVALLATIAVPSFSTFIANNRTQAGADEVYGLLQYARAFAAQDQTRVRVCLANGELSIRRACSDTTAIRTVTPPADVTLQASASAVAFLHSGTADQAVRYTVCRDGEAATGFTVTVAATGSIRRFARGQTQGAAMTSCTP